MRYLLIVILACLTFAFSCEKKSIDNKVKPLQLMEIPPGFPDVQHSENNEFTTDRWELGKKLFYDPILSKDGSISCGSCHNPELAFSDDQSFSKGVEGLIGTRNSPSLANIAYHPYFTREGGVPTLEMQVLVPIQEHNEFNSNIVLIADTLQKIPAYLELAKKAYDQEPNAFVITRALALFERSIISGQSLYDIEFNYENHGVMSASAMRGWELFMSDKTSCSSCHSGFNFTDYSFENNGLYEEYNDNGRERLTNNPEDEALFKVPSLRNSEVTSPYMHDGSIATLEEVIEHYDSGGKQHINKSELIRPLGLTDGQKKDLLAFLKSLTDKNLLRNKDLAEN